MGVHNLNDEIPPPIDLDTNGLGWIKIDQRDDDSPLPSRVRLTQEQLEKVVEFAQKIKKRTARSS